MPATGSSIGGVSAVNPQARGNYQQYQDAAYQNARLRLDPIQQQQTAAFDQSMINRGAPMGGEGYNEARQQLSWNQSDADKQAAFNAMQFGLDVQAQDFGQDATRSSLANALLQQKWGTDLGYAGIAEGGRQFDAGLGEQGRQFNQGLGLQYDMFGQQNYEFDQNLGNRQYEFDAGLGNRQYEFDRGLDYQYYDLDSRYDYMWDRAGQDDFRFGVGQDRQDYYDQQGASRYDDAFLMQLLGMGGQPGVYSQDPTSAYNAQIGQLGRSQRQMTGIQNDMFGNAMGAFGL